MVSYNADGDVTKGVPDIGTNRLCYVGQALYTSGQQLGERIKQVVPTPGEVVIFISDPRPGEHPAPLRRRRLGAHAAGLHGGRDQPTGATAPS